MQQVKKIGGDLGLMPLQDLLGWAEAGMKTGSLKVWSEQIVKTFYLQEGKIVFLTSNREGERVGEFLARRGHLSLTLIRDAIGVSQQRGIPFTRFLLEEKMLDRASLESAISELVVHALADAMCWKSGMFQFSDALPPAVLNGPVKLLAGNLLEEAARQVQQERGGEAEEDRELLRELARRIAQGDFDIPPMPDILIRVNECLRQEDSSVNEVIKIIMADQILTSKILRVANSAYYGRSTPVTSLPHAIVMMGFKTMVGIVTAYTLNRVFVRNAEETRSILRHSLMCAYLARKIGAAVGFDEEDAFVCGLLHDIGKTVLITLLDDYDLAPATRQELIRGYHPQVGSLVAIKWHFPETVRNAVRFHHEPEKAAADRTAAETVWLADNLLHQPQQAEAVLAGCSSFASAPLDAETLLAEIERIEEAASAIL